MIKWLRKLFVKEHKDPRTTILVVDDNEEIRNLLWLYLEPRGFRTLRAVNGADALRQLEKEVPDLMLLDITMPEMSGFEVLVKIRTDDRLRSLPVLMVTDISLVSKVEQCYDLGVKGYILKPFELDRVMQKVNSVLSGTGGAR